MADTTLTPEEQRFFETGELQPGMQPEPSQPEVAAAPPPPEPTQPPVAPPATTEPTLEHQQVSTEAADILRRSLEEAQRRVGALEAYIQQLQNTQQQPTAPPAPDSDVDPLGAMLHKLEQVNKTVADLQAALNQQQSQQSQLTQFQQFQQRVGQLRDEFAKTTPDFDAAYAHIRNARISDLRAYGLTDEKIQQAIFQEEATLAENAIRNGRNPAQVIYEMSKRHGYVPKAAPAAAPPATPDAKLLSIQQAQTASKTLPSTPALDDITVEGLKGASDSDLNKFVTDDKLWAKIVGSDQHPI